MDINYPVITVWLLFARISELPVCLFCCRMANKDIRFSDVTEVIDSVARAVAVSSIRIFYSRNRNVTV